MSDAHRHESRVGRLRDAGVSIDCELRERIRADYYRPRSSEQVASDEAVIATLEAQHAGAIAALERKERAERLGRYDLPITAADAELVANGALEPTRVLRATRVWLDGASPLLLQSGPPGRGKTLAAADALVRLPGSYVRAGTLARLFMASYGSEVQEREELVRAPRLLVIDDVGTERNADAMGSALVEVLDARRRGQRNLWITNLSRAAFEQRYPDARLHSRIAQSGVWCIDDGADLRRAGVLPGML